MIESKANEVKARIIEAAVAAGADRALTESHIGVWEAGRYGNPGVIQGEVRGYSTDVRVSRSFPARSYHKMDEAKMVDRLVKLSQFVANYKKLAADRDETHKSVCRKVIEELHPWGKSATAASWRGDSVEVRIGVEGVSLVYSPATGSYSLVTRHYGSAEDIKAILAKVSQP